MGRYVNKLSDRIGCNSSQLKSDFLRLDLLQDVSLEIARTAKEAHLRSRHRIAFYKTTFYQMKRANKIRQLKKPVIRGMHTLRELNAFTKFFLEGLVKKIGDRGLSAIVIDLDGLNVKKIHAMRRNEIHKLPFKPFDDLPEVVDKLLVDVKTMVFERHLLRKRHHTREYAATPFSAHELIPLLFPNQRTGVKAMSLKSNLVFSTLQVSHIAINGL